MADQSNEQAGGRKKKAGRQTSGPSVHPVTTGQQPAPAALPSRPQQPAGFAPASGWIQQAQVKNLNSPGNQTPYNPPPYASASAGFISGQVQNAAAYHNNLARAQAQAQASASPGILSRPLDQYARTTSSSGQNQIDPGLIDPPLLSAQPPNRQVPRPAYASPLTQQIRPGGFAEAEPRPTMASAGANNNQTGQRPSLGSTQQAVYVRQMANQLTATQTRVRELEAENNDCKTRTCELEAENDDCKTNLATYQARISELEVENNGLNTKSVTDQARIRELETENNGCKMTLAAGQARIRKLEADNNDHQTNLAKASTELRQKEQRMGDLEKALLTGNQRLIGRIKSASEAAKQEVQAIMNAETACNELMARGQAEYYRTGHYPLTGVTTLELQLDERSRLMRLYATSFDRLLEDEPRVWGSSGPAGASRPNQPQASSGSATGSASAGPSNQLQGSTGPATRP